MNNMVLLVDDDHNILSAYQRLLRKKFELVTVDSGVKGIAALLEQGPFAVVVSDYRMPEMDGVRFLSAARQVSPDTVRIMLTGQADFEATIDAVNEGNIFRFLTKPCPTDHLMDALSAAVEQYRLITAERELLDNTLKGTIKLLIDVLSMVNPAAFSQSSRIIKIVRRLSTRLNVKEKWKVELAAMLSQIGCVTIPGEILQKKYQGLTLSESENEMFLAHPKTGKDLLENIPRLEDIAEGIAYQMKRFDGTGVPADNLQGMEIPFIARILKVALDFDTYLTAGNSYVQSFDIMYNQRQWYDSDVLAALEADILNIEEGFVVRSIELSSLLSGMILADDIVDLNKRVLIPKGSEITEVLKRRLLNYARFGNIAEPIKVIEQLK
ncbi:MAG: Hydrogenase transcriptional regulatory protein hupR1 [Pelotomaculum sp. PtaU1.Bin035]|nr:MAG: Hydrogenase transcriptional regulatory protein hupR1 [Pelotomaculum sp. PtaU1.Bin035]